MVFNHNSNSSCVFRNVKSPSFVRIKISTKPATLEATYLFEINSIDKCIG